MNQQQRKLRLWEMEHWQPEKERPSSAERERRIAQKQREKFDREERIRHIDYPIVSREEDRPVTVPRVSPELLEHTFSSRAKTRQGLLYASPVRNGWQHSGGSAYRDSTYYRSPSPYHGSHPSSIPRSQSYAHYGPSTYQSSTYQSYSPYRSREGMSRGEMGIIPNIVRRQRPYVESDLGAERHLPYTSWGPQRYASDDMYSGRRAHGYDSVLSQEEDYYSEGERRPEEPRRAPSPQRHPSPPRQPKRSNHHQVSNSRYSGSQASSLKVRTNRAQQLRERHTMTKGAANSSPYY